jgi:diaminopropionate ammonia-lyase family
MDKEFQSRIDKVVNEMIINSFDMLIISSPENMYYLSNYQTVGNPIQVLIITKNKYLHLITRELEATNAKYRTNISYSYYDENEDPIKNITNYIKTIEDIKTIGFEYNSDRISYKSQLEFNKYLHQYQFKDCSSLVSKIRSIKSELEINHVRKAAQFVMNGINAGIKSVKPGIIETEIAGVITNKMMSLGCEYTAYPCFVASGYCGCMGHYTAAQKIVEENELLFMEIGGCYKRYHASKMHTIYIGNSEPEWFIEARKIIQDAIRSVKKIMIPGTRASIIDKYMRDIISKYDYLPFKQSERSGYSIGIGFYTDWGENDVFKIYPTSNDILRENMTIHLIPWIQIIDVGAIGFSDTVLITKTGAISLFDGYVQERYELAFNYINKDPVEHTSNMILQYMNKHIMDVLEYHSNTESTSLITRTDIKGINNLYIKDESNRLNQKAFKVLGVSYALHKLVEEGILYPGDTVTTMTDGNHGSALAYLANKNGYKAVIYVPNNMTQERIDKIESYGAKCIITTGNYDESIEVVKSESSKNGWHLISDTSWEGYEKIPRYIICGYTILFHEAYCSTLDSRPTHIFLQVGVGGFAAAGIAYAVLRMNPRPKLICVEPEDADCVFENVKYPESNGKAICKGRVDSIMAGLNCGGVSDIAWTLLRDYVSTYITIGDEWARIAVRDLYHHEQRIYSGESGGAGYAGLMVALRTQEIRDHLELSEDSNVLVVNTEGVTDKKVFESIIKIE